MAGDKDPKNRRKEGDGSSIGDQPDDTIEDLPSDPGGAGDETELFGRYSVEAEEGEPSDTEVTLVSATVADDLRDVEKASSAEMILDGFTGFEVGGKTLEQWIDLAEDFYEREALPHAEALRQLQSIVRESYPEMTDAEFDWKEVIKDLPTEVFYSSTASEFGTRRSIAMQMAMEAVAARFEEWDRDPDSPYHFLHGKRGFPPQKALRAPRVIECEHLSAFNLDDQSEKDPRDFIKRNQQYQYLFLTVCSEKLGELEQKKRAKGDRIPEKEEGANSERPSLHRVANIFAQISCLYSIKLRRREKKIPSPRGPVKKALPEDDSGFKIPAIALRFFEEKESRERVDEYIRANLSLILPNKEGGRKFIDETNDDMRLMTNEDMILMNLMVLAEESGLYEKYKDIFRAIYYYRRLQNVRGFQWDPRKITLDPDPACVPLKDLVEGYRKEHGKAPTVLSFGYGDGMLEGFLLSRKAEDQSPLVEQITGVEIDINREFGDGPTVICEGRMVKIIFGVKDRIIRQDRYWHEDPALMDEIMEYLSKADIVIANDSLHETSRPLHYAVSLYEKVNPEGYFYFTEPDHSEAIDAVTHVSQHPYDRTRWQDSMVPYEAYLNLAHWLTNVEGAFNNADESESNSPGLYAGNNDTYARRRWAFLKPRDPSSHAAYQFPNEATLWEKVVENDSQIFEMWPLKLVPERDRAELLRKMVERMRQRPEFRERESLVLINPETPDIEFEDLKRRLIEMLISPREVDAYGGNYEEAYRRRLGSRSPYPKIEKMVMDTAGGRRIDVILQNHVAGEVLVLRDLVREIAGINLPLGPGW
jgi:hypothetical protein